MTRCYISGPMSNMPDLNFPAFHRAAASLRASGYDVVNPAELDAADIQQMEWHQYLRRDIVFLVSCDAIAMLPGWEKSKGARLEKHIAEQLGMRVIFYGHHTQPAPQTLRERIDSVEREMVAQWGEEGARDLAQVQDQLARAREQLLPARRWWQFWRPACI